jgi:hypothetical protein
MSHQKTQQTQSQPHQILVKISSNNATADTRTTPTIASWSTALPISSAAAAGTATADNSNNYTDNEKDDVVGTTTTTTSSIVAFRPSTPREHLIDSGLDERSPLSKPKRDSNTAVVVATSVQRGPSPHHLMPLLHLLGQSLPSASSLAMPCTPSTSGKEENIILALSSHYHFLSTYLHLSLHCTSTSSFIFFCNCKNGCRKSEVEECNDDLPSRKVRKK